RVRDDLNTLTALHTWRDCTWHRNAETKSVDAPSCCRREAWPPRRFWAVWPHRPSRRRQRRASHPHRRQSVAADWANCANTRFAPGDIRGVEARFSSENLPHNLALVELVKRWAERKKATPAQ